MARFFNPGIYAPPGVYTQTIVENPLPASVGGLKVPVIIGTGNEVLFQSSVEMVRGSSSRVDQKVVQEDETGRAVTSITETGEVLLGDFDGVLTRFQVKNLPIVDGSGVGRVTNSTSVVSVIVNGQALVVVGVDGAKGIITLAQAPPIGAEVTCTYFFNRTDTAATDDLSNQVTSTSAILTGQTGEDFTFVAGENDVFTLSWDGRPFANLAIPEGTWNASQVAVFLNTQASGSLVASTVTNNFGAVVVRLVADQSIVIGSGTANAALGFNPNDSTTRNRDFYTFQRPIVDGSNGGITTTDPSDVVVKINGTPVIPSAVDGANGKITLAQPPKVGATVVVSYFFNSYQDTFDELPDLGVLGISRAGLAPNRNDFITDVDFIVKDNRIFWGAGSRVSTNVSTLGSPTFGETQITATLVDDQWFFASCTPVVDTTVVPARDSRRVFQLPAQPTTGNGRNTPLSSVLFNDVSNGRVDVPTNRPDLVQAYWGFSLAEAQTRGPVAVTKIDSENSTLELATAIPAGASVWATFYYNRLTDSTYNVEVDIVGVSGTGTYAISDTDENTLLNVAFGAKSGGLAGIDLVFPSGSQSLPQAFVSGGDAVTETVTVTFVNTDDTPATFTVKGASPYYFADSASDKLRLLVDGAALSTGAAGIDLKNPTVVAGVNGFFASLVSDEIEYTPSTGNTTYTITSSTNEINLEVDGVEVAASAAAGAGSTVAAFVTAINTAAAATNPEYTSAGKFNSPVTIAVGEYDELIIHYTGVTEGASGNITAAIAAGTYASPVTLATAVETALNAAIALESAPFDNIVATVEANAEGNLVFSFDALGTDAQSFVEFITHGTPAQDFAILAGISTAAATGGNQVKLCNVAIARRFTVAGASSSLLHDRLVLRNRLFPGAGSVHPQHAVNQTSLTVRGSSGSELTGLVAGTTLSAGYTATITKPSLLGVVGFLEGQASAFGDARDGQPLITMYAEGNTVAQNNILRLNIDGVNVTVTFKDATGTAIASGTSADVPLGPVGSANTILHQINAALVAAGLASGLVQQEGAGIRINSARQDSRAKVEITNGNAHTRLGFTLNQKAVATPVTVEKLASALMSNHAATLSAQLFTFASPSATYFAAEALAYTTTDVVGAKYLTLQSLSLGLSSSIVLGAATANDALRLGSAIGSVAGEGDTGESAKSGFVVTSSDAVDGSGSSNTSILSSSGGQDGYVGQTYIDDVTGLHFTLLPRAGGLSYPSGTSFTFVVDSSITTNSNLPIYTIPGIELLVSSTSNLNEGDSALVETFDRSGAEPAIGDVYYISYSYTKTSLGTRLFTKLSTVEAEFGAVSPDNPLSLAVSLAFTNGATLVGTKQTRKNEGSSISEISEYIDALDDLTAPLTRDSGLKADIIVPLIGNSLVFFEELSKHIDIQSSPRFAQERTALCGVSAGTAPETIIQYANAMANERFRFVYPDILSLTVVDPLGNETVTQVDGYYFAAAFAGSNVAPQRDVATPWTRRQIFGFNSLSRTLNQVEVGTIAQAGVTVAEAVRGSIRIAQGLTTDMSNVLTRTPTVTQIADEVHVRQRNALDSFIGAKYLKSIIPQIESSMTSTLVGLQNENIIQKFTGVRAYSSLGDPTAVETEAYYAPIFPLLYIYMTFGLRSSI